MASVAELTVFQMPAQQQAVSVACKLMTDLTNKFFTAYLTAFNPKTVFTKDTPREMMVDEPNDNGWFEWKLIDGTLSVEDYKTIEDEFKVQLPTSFLLWHMRYFFLNADTSILRLPTSNPNSPLTDLKQKLDWFIAEQLIPQKLYPFGDEGNDAGPLVFDGRVLSEDNEFPIRYYDHEFGGDLEGLSEIIFSSFEKLLQCLTHYMTELKERRNFEIIPDFFKIDPAGAGSSGIDYWLSWTNMQKANFEEFGY